MVIFLKLKATSLAVVFCCLSLFLTTCQFPKKEEMPFSSLRFIGEKQLPDSLFFETVRVGGFSGIDYDEETDTYLVICDDMAEYGPTRFYRLNLYYNEHALDSVVIKGQTTLLRPDSNNFLPRNSPMPHLADPEAIRLDPSTKTIYWTSEGDISSLSQPFIRQATLNGKHIHDIPLSPMFALTTLQKGVRPNAAFESLSLSTDQANLWVTTEVPLFEDGEKPQYYPTISPVRLSLLDKKTGYLHAQFPYMLEKVAKKPANDSMFYVNGVVEILALDRHRLLVLERSYTAGYADGGNVVKLFLANTHHATNVKDIPSLHKATFTPVTKKLLLDFAQLPLKTLDNIEGFCWGKTLENGHRTLVFVSDNNFNDEQVTQFIVLEVIP